MKFTLVVFADIQTTNEKHLSWRRSSRNKSQTFWAICQAVSFQGYVGQQKMNCSQFLLSKSGKKKKKTFVPDFYTWRFSACLVVFFCIIVKWGCKLLFMQKTNLNMSACALRCYDAFSSIFRDFIGQTINWENSQHMQLWSFSSSSDTLSILYFPKTFHK